MGGGNVNADGGSVIAPPGLVNAHVDGVNVPAHERVVLANGMTLIVMPRHDIPLVSFNAVLRGGESAGAPGKSGVASLVAGLLEKGAGKPDGFAFVDAVYRAGGNFNAAAAPDS